MTIEKRLEYILSLQKEIESRIVDLQCDIKGHISTFQSMIILYSIGNIDVIKYQNDILIRVLRYNNQKQWRIISQTEGIIDYGTTEFSHDVQELEKIFQKTKEAKQ